MMHESKVSQLDDEMREMEEIERSLIRWSLVILRINRETSLNKPQRHYRPNLHHKQS